MSQVLLTLAVRLLVVIAGLLSSIVTARYLGPEGRGWFFFWTTLAMLIVQFGNFGLHASNTYLLAKKGVDVHVLASNSLVGALIAGLAWTIAGLAVASLLGQQEAWSPRVAIPLLLMSVTGLYFLLSSNLLVALGRLTAYNVLEILSKALSLCALILAAVFWGEAHLLLWGLAAAGAVTSVVLGWWLRRHIRLVPPSAAILKLGFSYGLKAYVVACLAALVSRLNAFLLEPSIPPADYGAWSIASQIFDVLTLLPASVALVMLPRIMRSSEPHRMVRINALAVAGIMLVVSAGFILVGQPLIILLYGEAYGAAFDYVIWGLPGLVALSVISVLSQYMATIGLPRALILLWATVATLQAAVAIWLIPEHGATGAMVSLSVAYVTGLMLMFSLIHRLKDKHA
ncbi:oligosaccharide flippase family protein [Hydrogenophaga sp. XSHU_21]